MNEVRDKLKLKIMEKQKLTVKEVFCEEQQCDLEEMVGRVEDLVATAVACGSSPQNYSELQRAKGEYVNFLLELAEKYRIVVTK